MSRSAEKTHRSKRGSRGALGSLVAAAATAAVSCDGISVDDGVPTVRSSIAISNGAQKTV